MAREILSERRKQLGLSQKLLGTLVGLDASAISRIEKGYCDLAWESAEKLASVLNVRVDEVPNVLPPKLTSRRSAPTPLSVSLPTGEIGASDVAAATCVESLVVSDLSNPKSFNQLPNVALLERAATAELRMELSRELQYAERVLQTSGVTPPMWREWRAFEKAVREKLRTAAANVRVVVTTTPATGPATGPACASISTAQRPVNGKSSNENPPDPRLGSLTLPPQGIADNAEWRAILSAEIDRLRLLKHEIRFAKSDFDLMRSYWKELHAALSELDAREGIATHSGETERSGYNALFFRHAESLVPNDWFIRCKMEAGGHAMSDTSKGFLRHFRLCCERHLTQGTLDEINSAVLRSRGRISREALIRYVPLSTPVPVAS